jgi:hypothetical protein
MRRLEPKHVFAAMCIAGGCPKNQICDKLNIKVETLCKWQKDPLFAAEVEMYTMKAYDIWEKQVIGFLPGLADRLMKMTFSEKTKDKDILTLAEFAHKVKTKPELQPGVKVEVNVANRSDADIRIDDLFREAGTLLRCPIVKDSTPTDTANKGMDSNGGSKPENASDAGNGQAKEDKGNS